VANLVTGTKRHIDLNCPESDAELQIVLDLSPCRLPTSRGHIAHHKGGRHLYFAFIKIARPMVHQDFEGVDLAETVLRTTGPTRRHRLGS